jgi:hypothetical protein
MEARPPVFMEVLNDAGGKVELDTTGAVHAPAGVEQGQETLLADAIKAKSRPMAAVPSDLAAPPGTLLGPSKPDEFAPLAPLSTVVYSDTPDFRWQPLKGATLYEVQVFEERCINGRSSPTGPPIRCARPRHPRLTPGFVC